MEPGLNSALLAKKSKIQRHVRAPLHTSTEVPSRRFQHIRYRQTPSIIIGIYSPSHYRWSFYTMAGSHSTERHIHHLVRKSTHRSLDLTFRSTNFLTLVHHCRFVWYQTLSHYCLPPASECVVVLKKKWKKSVENCGLYVFDWIDFSRHVPRKHEKELEIFVKLIKSDPKQPFMSTFTV